METKLLIQLKSVYGTLRPVKLCEKLTRDTQSNAVINKTLQDVQKLVAIKNYVENSNWSVSSVTQNVPICKLSNVLTLHLRVLVNKWTNRQYKMSAAFCKIISLAPSVMCIQHFKFLIERTESQNRNAANRKVLGNFRAITSKYYV